jgi:hypothetical protein
VPTQQLAWAGSTEHVTLGNAELTGGVCELSLLLHASPPHGNGLGSGYILWTADRAELSRG